MSAARLAMMRAAFLLLLVLAAAGASAQAPEPARAAAARTMLAAQRTLVVDRNADSARAGFLAALRQDSTYAAPRFNLGVLAEATRNWSEAERWFSEYLTQDTVSEWAAKARVELTRVHRLNAIEADSVGRRQSEFDAHIELGRRLAAAGMLDDALSEAGRAHALDRERWEPYALAAAALAPQHQCRKATALLDTAIMKAPAAAASPLRASRESLIRPKGPCA